jgi:N-acyl-D-amino-acid deacylase
MDLDNARMQIIFYYRTEEDMRAFLRHSLGMMGSDGLAIAPGGKLGTGKPHPRSYGAHARVLGRYVREEPVLSLEEAVYKMSGQVADRLQLRDRGRIAMNQIADLVVFDPTRVVDQADFDNPHQYPLGIEHVMINGQWVIRQGEHTGALPGRVLEPG